jgi:serine phosphatase RsbU (regulator of sigma subunit)
MKTKLIFILIFWSLFSFSKESTPKDSLINVAENTSDLRERFDLYYAVITYSLSENYDEYKKWANKTWTLIEELDNDSLRMKLHILEGGSFPNKGDNEEKINHLLSAIKISEKLDDSVGMAAANYSMGGFYFWKQKPDLARKYIEIAMLSYPESGNPLKKATYTMAYGVVLQNTDKKGAVKYHEEALNIKRKAKAWKQIPISLNNLAELKVELGDTVYAIELLEESIHICQRHDIQDAEVYAEFILGQIYNSKKEYSKALQMITKSVQWWENHNYLKDLPRAYKEIAISYTGVGDHRGATRVWKKYVEISEKLFESDQLNAVQELETKYETEKKEIALAKEKEEKELARKETELVKENERTRLISFSIIGVLLIGGGIYVYTLYRKQKKDKSVISNQKMQLEVRNKEVEDSIIYAKRIQNAILPQNSVLNQELPEHFILYKPKDIIAGDFYWMQNTNDSVLLAAADCTGHGVPGAMVSVVCNNGLNRSVREFGLNDPGKILDKTRELVIQEFEKSEEEVKDGMDIALVSIMKNQSNSSSSLKYAGAHNPLWVVRKNGNEIEEIKANKQPIGKYDDLKSYTTHHVDLNKGDLLYLFSDGFSDQFGGDKGKKMKAANFKRLLLSMIDQPMKIQKKLLNDAFETWRGDLEQVDDVCVIGIRI